MNFQPPSLNNKKAKEIQPKLKIGPTDDQYEQEADAMADQVLQMPKTPPPIQRRVEEEELQMKPLEEKITPIIQKKSEEEEELQMKGFGDGMIQRKEGEASPEISNQLSQSKGSGTKLSKGTNEFMSNAFGTDFSNVNIHTDTQSVQMNRSLGARAFTHGSDVYFNEGEYNPNSSKGKHLLAHELTHVVQQGQAIQAKTIQRSPEEEEPDYNIHDVPSSWIVEPDEEDSLVITNFGKLLLLPAFGNMVAIKQPPSTLGGSSQAGARAATGSSPSQSGARMPETPVFTVPTIGKEGLIMVRVNNRTGFLLDAGGKRIVVFPHALSQMKASLGITGVKGLIPTHIHGDHVRNFAELIRAERIKPANIYIPQAFVNNPSAPTSTLAKLLDAVKADPSLRSLGHGPNANYNMIRTPATGTYFHKRVTEGQVHIDLYGITNAFKDLQESRRRGKKPGSNADTASLLTLLTHRPSGMKTLFLGDLRGSDLTLFRQAMGESTYNQMIKGVKVIEGFQHHMGAMEKPADRQGLTDLMLRAQRNGNVKVIVQTQEAQSHFRLNRSLVSALQSLGVDVYLATTPRDGQVGTFTVSSKGNVSQQGRGNLEVHRGNTAMQEHIQRLVRLNRAETILGQYKDLLQNGAKHHRDASAARQSIQALVLEYYQKTMEGVKTGSARANSGLSPEAQQQQRRLLERLNNAHFEIETMIRLSVSQETLRQLEVNGKHIRTFNKEMKRARQTGRLSNAGIDALWQVNPRLRDTLLKNSSLSAREKRRVAQKLPGASIGRGPKAVLGFFIVLELANTVGPLYEGYQASEYAKNVADSIRKIIWWQSKGVNPELEATDDGWFGNTEGVTDPTTINKMLEKKEIDLLAITNIPDAMWDMFLIWASANITDFREWNAHIVEAEKKKTIKGEGEFINNRKWYYQKNKIVNGTIDFYLEPEWVYSADLTRILNAAATYMHGETEKRIQDIAKKGGPKSQGQHISSPERVSKTYESQPRASLSGQKKTFKSNIEEPRLYTIARQRSRYGFKNDAQFYIFDNDIVNSKELDYEVPEGYVLVGGANYSTYVSIYYTRNFVKRPIMHNGEIYSSYDYLMEPNGMEMLLAWEKDLVNV